MSFDPDGKNQEDSLSLRELLKLLLRELRLVRLLLEQVTGETVDPDDLDVENDDAD